MTEYPIISNASFPPTVPGPKKGSLRFDNRQVVHEAAVKVIDEGYSATNAARSLMHRYQSHGALQSRLTMLVRKINFEVAKMNSDTKAEKSHLTIIVPS
jgi:hypothetical protein